MGEPHGLSALWHHNFQYDPRSDQPYAPVIVLPERQCCVQFIIRSGTSDSVRTMADPCRTTAVSGSATVSLSSFPATVSVSETFVFTSASCSAHRPGR